MVASMAAHTMQCKVIIPEHIKSNLPPNSTYLQIEIILPQFCNKLACPTQCVHTTKWILIISLGVSCCFKFQQFSNGPVCISFARDAQVPPSIFSLHAWTSLTAFSTILAQLICAWYDPVYLYLVENMMFWWMALTNLKDKMTILYFKLKLYLIYLPILTIHNYHTICLLMKRKLCQTLMNEKFNIPSHCI